MFPANRVTVCGFYFRVREEPVGAVSFSGSALERVFVVRCTMWVAAVVESFGFKGRGVGLRNAGHHSAMRAVDSTST